MDTSFTNGHRIFVSELEVGAALLVLVAWMEFLMGHGEVWFLGSLTYVFLLHSIRCKSGLNTACGAYGIVIHSYVCVALSLHAVRIVSQTGKEGINTETEILQLGVVYLAFLSSFIETKYYYHYKFLWLPMLLWPIEISVETSHVNFHSVNELPALVTMYSWFTTGRTWLYMYPYD